jgi:hypothetical protein
VKLTNTGSRRSLSDATLAFVPNGGAAVEVAKTALVAAEIA